ncbi:MAG: FIST C-terminal domain-containing protein [Nitrospirae bacterium]|nr:FIST C-terminal domain-containing protein [Nitrospirota bacterium]
MAHRTPAETRTEPMIWRDALSTEATLVDAVAACADALGPAPEGGWDMLFAFASTHYPDLDQLAALLARHVPHRHLLGCSGGGIIGAGREIEFNPAVSLVAARLPDVTITPFHVTADDLADVGRGPSAWHGLVGAPREGLAGFVLVGDPFSLPMEVLLEGLDFAYAGVPVVGGLASGGDGPEGNVLFLDGAPLRSGAVGVALSGALRIDTVVAQGVRPIGPTMMVTKADGHHLFEVDNHPVLEVLSDLFDEIPEEDRALARHALFLGVAQRAADDNPGHGDFLVRNLLGADEPTQSLVVGEFLREGQLVRLHVRDAATSAFDLDTLLSGYVERRPLAGTAGALLFSCLGRGRGLYGAPDHDSSRFRAIIGNAPLGGFFCNGEIGPVGDTTYLHGYTSAFALFGRP